MTTDLRLVKYYQNPRIVLGVLDRLLGDLYETTQAIECRRQQYAPGTYTAILRDKQEHVISLVTRTLLITESTVHEHAAADSTRSGRRVRRS